MLSDDAGAGEMELLGSNLLNKEDFGFCSSLLSSNKSQILGFKARRYFAVSGSLAPCEKVCSASLSRDSNALISGVHS
ncbi:MAG: hypothetical protein KDK65_02705 [Chlamydiia bacterium]|nr:hypothetical protein [Chlamydiia bacterium]